MPGPPPSVAASRAVRAARARARRSLRDPADLAEVGRLSPGAQFALQRAQAERPGAMLLPVRLDDGVRDACWLPPGDPGTVAAAMSERVRAADVRLRGPSGASGGRLVIGLRDRSGRILAIVHPTPASGAAARRAADARAGSVLVRGGGRASRNAIVEAIRTAGS